MQTPAGVGVNDQASASMIRRLQSRLLMMQTRMHVSASLLMVSAHVPVEIRAPAHAPIERRQRGDREGDLNGRCRSAAYRRLVPTDDVRRRL